MGLDPGEEVGDFGEDSGLSLAGAGSPGDHADDVELTGLGLGGADERAARVTHAGGGVVRAKSDHARLDHVGPAFFQVGVSPDLALELLELVGHVSGGPDETPAGEPASFGAMVVVIGVGHASGTSVSSGKVNVFGQLDQSDVMLDGVGLVEFGMDNDLGDRNILLSSVIVLLTPFSYADGEFRGYLGLSEAVSGAKHPSGSDQSTSANVLFPEEGERGESEGDLPGELAVGGGESVDDAAAGPLLAASFKSGGASHDGD